MLGGAPVELGKRKDEEKQEEWRLGRESFRTYTQEAGLTSPEQVRSSVLCLCPLAGGGELLGPVSSLQVHLAPRPSGRRLTGRGGVGGALTAQPGELVLSLLSTV